MINIKRKEDCCGCNACGDACPYKAISFTTDIEGFWYPVIDKEKCVDCGLCEKVCPVIHADEIKKNDMINPICYAANNKNLEIRFDSTSGGAFTGFAEPFLKENGFVGGAVYTKDWEVKQVISHSIEDLPKLRSSKYIQSDATGYYSQIRHLLKAGEKVMAVGLPCQIAALKCFLGKEFNNLITVDLICRYINSPKAYKKYLSYLEREYKSKVVYIKAKNKELGWHNLTHKVVFANGSTYYGTIAVDKFMKASMKSNCLSRPSCYVCRFKGFPRYADISLGDYWVKGKRSALDDDTGTSVILINSYKGKEYFEKVKSKFQREEVSLKDVLKGNPALQYPLPKESIRRDVFYQRLQTEEFDKVVDSMCISELSLKQKLKIILRTIYRQLSFGRWRLKPMFQFIYYNFFHPAVKGSFQKGNVLHIAPHCVLEIDKRAKIKLNGPLYIGKSVFRHSNVETRIRMQNGAIMEIGNLGNNGYGFGYGSDIEIFPNAVLISKGGPSTNMNTTIICQSKIVIGQEVAIGRNVTIRDNNGGHKISINGYIDKLPVIIGEHVWLCEGCTIMSGVKIGDGSIVGAKTLLNKSLPPHVVVYGNPARITQENISWKM